MFMSTLPSAVQFILFLRKRWELLFDELSYACTKYSRTEHLSVDENILLLEDRVPSNSIYERNDKRLG
jgi:hypothetical protein